MKNFLLLHLRDSKVFTWNALVRFLYSAFMKCRYVK